jgi:hypothetical protein
MKMLTKLEKQKVLQVNYKATKKIFVN